MSQVLTITDAASGTTAHILPSLGFNLFSLEMQHRGENIDLLWAEDGFEAGDQRPSGSGIPILFPFPGRLLGTRFDWEGRTYEFAPADGRGNAIHGLAYDRPWRVIDQSETHVVGQFQLAVDGERPNAWPSDFRITVTYHVQARQLQASYLVENTGQSILPWGLGLHPYFRVPLGSGSADDCQVQLPVTQRWILNEMLPTGELEQLDAQTYRDGLRLADMQFDDVFTGLDAHDNQRQAQVVDPANRRTVRLSFDTSFRECVVYNPAHREAVCIEPYTCLPGAVQLEQRGVDAGLERLAPGESRELTMRVELAG